MLGIRRGDRIIPSTEPLQSGDALLVRGTWQAIGRLANEPRNFVVVGRPEVLARQVTQLSGRSIIALAALAGMVVLMVSGVVPFVIAALLAAGTMIVGGCLTTTQAYRTVSWSTIVLIGAMIPMAVALESTGGAQWVSDRLVDTVGAAGPDGATGWNHGHRIGVQSGDQQHSYRGAAVSDRDYHCSRAWCRSASPDDGPGGGCLDGVPRTNRDCAESLGDGSRRLPIPRLPPGRGTPIPFFSSRSV